MTVRAETNFLSKQRASGANVSEPELAAYRRAKRAELEKLVSQPASAEVGAKFPVLASALKKHLAAEGEVELFAGNLGGWSRIREAQAFEYWEAKVQERRFERDARPDRRRLGLSVAAFADCLVALHVGAKDTAAALMVRLVGESHESSNSYWQASTSALTFQARLYELLTGETLRMDWSKLLPLGPYEALLSEACVGKAYVDALDWACTEHIAQTRETKQVFLPFAVGLSTAMPVEIMTWLRYRRQVGLEHATHGHPLLESPLANLDPPSAAASPEGSELLTLLERAEPHLHAYLAE